ncbi:hypothetical protein J6590_043039 [Homalodisca vitripennis]|nr:hypothetical protein J6590_043039 [Homalodisca vitripennis]
MCGFLASIGSPEADLLTRAGTRSILSAARPVQSRSGRRRTPDTVSQPAEELARSIVGRNKAATVPWRYSYNLEARIWPAPTANFGGVLGYQGT